jgi:hypothetical protein
MNTFNKYTSKSLWLTVILLSSLLAGCFHDNSNDPTGAVPTVTSTIPADAATAVPTNQKVIARFSAAMKDTSIDSTSFTVVGASEPALVGTVSLDAASNTAIFEPNSNLTASKVYTATITTAATSSGGKALASDYVWTFTSGTVADATAPTVVSSDPADTETGVILNKTVAATFDEALDPSTVDTTSFTLTADSGATVIAGSVSTSNRVVTFKPDSNLVADTLYTATLTTAITDTVVPGNALAADHVWSFTTGTEVATGPTGIYLGTAANFAIMSGTGVTSEDGSAVITGNIGASGITGASITVDCTELATGEVYTDDANYPGFTCTAIDKTAASLALADVLTAYTNASDPVTPAGVGPFLELGAGTVTAQTLVPGVYTWAGNVTITGELTLDGSATDVWIFQIGGTLDTNQAITLAGSALAKNVFWRVADVVTLGTGAQFQGIVLAKTKVDMISTATITGRLLAQTAVNLGSTTVVTQPAP